MCFQCLTVQLPDSYVPEFQRSLALGVGSFFYRVFAALPSPLVVGSILDSHCTVWETTCDGGRGSCWDYDAVKMSRSLLGYAAGFKLLTMVLLFLMWRTYTPAETPADITAAGKASAADAGPHIVTTYGAIESEA